VAPLLCPRFIGFKLTLFCGLASDPFLLDTVTRDLKINSRGWDRSRKYPMRGQQATAAISLQEENGLFKEGENKAH
jgi:hypothetical protein